MTPHLVALAQALLVTFLWSTSWVLIKVGLEDLSLPPLSFAGLRYVLAASALLPLALTALNRARPWRRGRPLLGRVVLLGLLLYAVTQGAQFAALVHLPAVAVGLALSSTPVVIALLTVRGSERPSLDQLLGIALLLAGATLYFGPLELGEAALLGLAIAAIGVVANAVAALLGRSLARDALAEVGGVIGLTALSMAVGSVVLLVVGLVIEGPPPLTAEAWLILGWLAVLNTAFAFTLWNHTLRTLTAVESGVMNNLMLVQIAILAWIFLGESLGLVEIAGLGLALAGIATVQLAPLAARRRAEPIPAGGAEASAAQARLHAPEAVNTNRPSSVPPRRVVLVGMMGSGKTTIGRLLAQRTGWPYLDNDELLARLFDTTPRRILDEMGEADLRRMEAEALRLGLDAPPPCFVGAAAGTILDEENRRRLRESGIVVWLRASVATLNSRAVGAAHRPWLDDDAEAWLQAAVEERDPLYAEVADIVIETDGRTADEIGGEILELIA